MMLKDKKSPMMNIGSSLSSSIDAPSVIPYKDWTQRYPFFILPTEQITLFKISPTTEIPLQFQIHRHTQSQNTSWHKSFVNNPPEHITVAQLAIVHQNILVALLPFQLIDVPFEKITGQIADCLIPLLSVSPYFSKRKDGQKTIRILMIGDLFFSNTKPHQNLPPDLLNQSVNWLEKQESTKESISLQIFKEFTPENRSSVETLTNYGYHSIFTEPEMILNLEDHWNHFDDYIQAMTTKYRQQYRSARKKGKSIRSRFLDQQELSLRHLELQPLLQAVINKSSFSLTPETTELYARLKEELGKKFLFRLYELDGAPIGFSTAIITPKGLIAHRVGLDYRFNRSHKLYQNILYDYVDTAFSTQCTTINYGRTALEIKSKVGAEPHPQVLLMRHPSWFPNLLLKWVLQFIPKPDWIQRHPFRHRPATKEPLVISAQKPSCYFLRCFTSFSCSST